MKLAFSGQARYADFSDGYRIYLSRLRGKPPVSMEEYRRAVKAYCRIIADRLVDDGFADLPAGIGSIAAATITRKPQYRGKHFIGYGGMDWGTGQYDGKLKTFGMVYLPRHGRNGNLRCLGYVANRRLFQRMKKRAMADDCTWEPIEFNDEMI